MRAVALAVVAVVGLDFGAGCGSSSSAVTTGPEMSNQKGGGGQGGQTVITDAGGADAPPAADAGGAPGGTGGTDGGLGLPAGETASCSVLETQYLNTLAGAQTCDPNAAGQCQQQVSAALSPCPTCMTYVNDAATVNTVKSTWEQLGCNTAGTASCPPLSCTQPTSATCMASSAGGTCASSPTN
jgi:hypothetical protein